MKLLAIETSSEACSVALSHEDGIEQRFGMIPRGHAEQLLPWIRELLLEAGLAPSELDVIAYSRGPGSFTSLRIGVSVVQGLAWGAGVPVVPVSSLAATAQAALCRETAPDVHHALVAMDARMGEAWCGEYLADDSSIMRSLGEERVRAPADIIAPGAPWVAVGNGFDRYEPLRGLAESAVTVHADAWPDALAVTELALDWLQHNEPLPAHRAQPVYIRDRVAEKPKRR